MRFLAVLFLCLSLFVQSVHAAPPDCTATQEGTIVYNKDRKLVQFCNGAEWIGMVAKIGGAGDTLSGLSCLNDEVPVWNGSAWVCGVGGGDSLWTDSGSGYLTYTGTDVGIKVQSITGMALPEANIGDFGCSANEILKWNGTAWACAADAAGSGGVTALTGDVTASGTGSVAATIAANAVTSAKILDGTVALADLAANSVNASKIVDGSVTNADLAGSIALSKIAITGTPDGSKFLRDDGAWTAAPSGADNLGNHTATTALNLNSNVITNAGGITSNNASGFNAKNSSGTSESWMIPRWTNDWMYTNYAANGWIIRDNSSAEKFRITAAGNLGIGKAPSTTLDVNGTATATLFAGSGASLTALNATNLASGTVPTARLGTGTANSSVFLRGDGTWAAPSGADNLGNHTATVTLNMANNTLSNVGQITTGPWNATYDTWLQGGASGATGGARNLALLGTDEDSGDTLYLNYYGEYSGGTRIGGSIADPAGNVIRDANGGWVRTYGATGWYSQTYGGGWNMSDSTWIRSYGGKWVYSDTGIRADGGGVRTTQVCDVNGANCRTPAQIAAGGGGGGGVGSGQTWSNPARSVNTSYQNTTGQPIMVSFAANGNNSAAVTVYEIQVSNNGSTWVTVAKTQTANYDNASGSMSAVVPDTHYYRYYKSGANTANVLFYAELR